jgi:hypothetical protein
MSNKPTTFRWPTRPVEETLERKTLEAVQRFHSAVGGIIKQGTFRASASTGNGLRLTEPRVLSSNLLAELKVILLTPASYWIPGHPFYRRSPPNPDFLFECRAEPYDLLIAVDLKNPGWRMFCHDESYRGFHFASRHLRPLVKKLFPEYASPSMSAMWKRGALPKETIGAATIPESAGRRPVFRSEIDFTEFDRQMDQLVAKLRKKPLRDRKRSRRTLPPDPESGVE